MKLYTKNFQMFEAEDSVHPLQMFGIERGCLIDESKGKDFESVMMRGDFFSVNRIDVAFTDFLGLAYSLCREDFFIATFLRNITKRTGYQKCVAFIHGFGNVLGDSFTGEERDLERMELMQV